MTLALLECMVRRSEHFLNCDLCLVYLVAFGLLSMSMVTIAVALQLINVEERICLWYQ